MVNFALALVGLVVFVELYLTILAESREAGR